MFEDASTETIKPSNNWKNKTRDQRISIVSPQLKKFAGAEDFVVVEADESGQIIIAIENGLPANKRGLYLLELEQYLKNNIDKGLHLWCEPVGDKSRLRNLRGVTIKT